MALPLFPVTEDPGPNLMALLEKSGVGIAPGTSDHQVTAPHATTVAALRYRGGVVMAGDRRATAGNVIAHRAMEKVFPADRFAAVAISGTAGTAMEMVKLFQVQLEHYEKVEGTTLSLEGKANQLSQMVRSNLPMAMQGFIVIPLFCGFDLARQIGRIFTYDGTGGRYEEADFAATGSGGRDARSTIKAGFREDLSEDEAVDLAIAGLYDAAEEDSATGGPDPLRGIYPIVAVVDSGGFRYVAEDVIAQGFERLIARRSAERGGVSR
jgi:proteasome beta subunit